MFHGVCRVDPLDPKRRSSRLTARAAAFASAAATGGDWFREPSCPVVSLIQELKVPMTVLAPIIVCSQVLYKPRPDGSHRPHGRLPIDQPGGIGKLIALKRCPKVFIKISHTWSIQAAVSVAGCAGMSATARRPGRRLMWATDWPIENVSTYGPHALRGARRNEVLNAEDKN